MMSPRSQEKLTNNGNFMNSVMPTASDAVSMRSKKKKHVVGDPDLVFWLTPSIE
jgi:hypothetical protein